jgi:hypothetical protein
MTEQVQPTRFGSWTFLRSNLTLYHEGGHFEIDLERCETAGQVLDWIAHLQGKAWATPEILGEAVDALCRLLDPQTTLCSFGSSGRLAPAALRQQLLDRERAVLADRLFTHRKHEIGFGRQNKVMNAGDMGRLADECRAQVDAMFDEGQ